jgi:hypothetical protein
VLRGQIIWNQIIPSLKRHTGFNYYVKSRSRASILENNPEFNDRAISFHNFGPRSDPSSLFHVVLLFHVADLRAHGLPLEPHIASLPLHFMRLARHDFGLTTIDDHLPNERKKLQEPNDNQKSGKCYDFPLYLCVIIGLGCGGVHFCGLMLIVSKRTLLGWLIAILPSVGLITDLGTFAFGDPLAFCRFRWLLGESDYCENYKYPLFHNSNIVTQKYLTTFNLCNTLIHMANVPSADKQTAIIAALAEGSSIRSIERITGVHRDTIMRLGVKVGNGCELLMDSKMQDLDCHYLQFDELWGFIGKKERHVGIDDNAGTENDFWTVKQLVESVS